MQKVLAKFLLEHAPLADLVGNSVDWDVSTQSALPPLVVMYLISSAPGYTMQGADGLVRSRVQFDCRGRTSIEARAVAAALEVRLSGFKGVFNGVDFGAAFKLSHRATFGKDGAEDWFLASMDFEIWSTRQS